MKNFSQRFNLSNVLSNVRPIAWVGLLLLIGLFLIAWSIRPIGLIHGPAMMLWKYPLIWKAPLLIFLILFGLGSLPHLIRKLASGDGKDKPSEGASRSRSDEDGFGYGSSYDYNSYRRRSRRARRPWFQVPLIVACFGAFLALIVACCTAGALTGRAIYEHYHFTDIKQLPANGSARLIPKEVAEVMASNGFNSSTSRLAQAHIVLDNEGNLDWTFGQVPNGTWRHYTASTQGMATLNAGSSARELKLTNKNFDISPDVRWSDNIKWQAYKRHFFTDVAETVFVLTPKGQPLLLAPYIKYTGFWVKVPELAGVYEVHPDGTIEDLSPEQAAARPVIVDSGHLFPEQLAKRVQESYQYAGGIWNRFFSHHDQTEIQNTEGNHQPYLMDFGEDGPKWVSTAKPYGNSHATDAVFLTDTVTGETEVWHVPKDQSYTGNVKALDIVRGLSIPGITFAGGEELEGKFKAIEPRPIIVNGELQFMVSIVPSSENTVTKTVIVDAKTNKAVAIFNHDTDPGADQKLKEYLETGKLPSNGLSEVTSEERSASESEERSDEEQPAGSSEVPAKPTGTTMATIEKLLEETEAQQQTLLELQAQLKSK